MKQIYKIKTQFDGHAWKWVVDDNGLPALYELSDAYKKAKDFARFCNVRVYKGTRVVWSF